MIAITVVIDHGHDDQPDPLADRLDVALQPLLLLRWLEPFGAADFRDLHQGYFCGWDKRPASVLYRQRHAQLLQQRRHRALVACVADGRVGDRSWAGKFGAAGRGAGCAAGCPGGDAAGRDRGGRRFLRNSGPDLRLVGLEAGRLLRERLPARSDDHLPAGGADALQRPTQGEARRPSRNRTAGVAGALGLDAALDRMDAVQRCRSPGLRAGVPLRDRLRARHMGLRARGPPNRRFRLPWWRWRERWSAWW